MPIEEQAEEKIQNAVQTIITGGAKLMLRIPKGVAMAMLRSGMKLAKTGVHAAGEAVKDGIANAVLIKPNLLTRCEPARAVTPCSRAGRLSTEPARRGTRRAAPSRRLLPSRP